MTLILIAGIVGMVACFIVGWIAGGHAKHEAAMDAAQKVILQDHLHTLKKLEGIGR